VSLEGRDTGGRQPFSDSGRRSGVRDGTPGRKRKDGAKRPAVHYGEVTAEEVGPKGVKETGTKLVWKDNMGGVIPKFTM